MRKTKLKPCPFCGNERLNYGQRLDEDTSLYAWFVECDECTCSVKVYNSTVDIIEKWNTRKPDMYKVIEQYRWERDVAISQLEELGIGFGEKIEDEVIKAVKEVKKCD